MFIESNPRLDGHHDIQTNEIGFFPGDYPQCRWDIPGAENLISLVFEEGLQVHEQIGFIIDDQNFILHGSFLPERCVSLKAAIRLLLVGGSLSKKRGAAPFLGSLGGRIIRGIGSCV
jgi:hypothetical protein